MSNHKYERLASNEEEMEEPKNTIQTPSTSSNASSSTDGMFITRHKGAATTQAYLQLLENALINKKLTSEQLTTILTQQNKDGWSVGMIISPHQDPTTTNQYRQLLKAALEILLCRCCILMTSNDHPDRPAIFVLLCQDCCELFWCQFFIYKCVF